MNTLQDLRATLDQHAHDVTGDPATVRVSAVHGRAASYAGAAPRGSVHSLRSPSVPPGSSR